SFSFLESAHCSTFVVLPVWQAPLMLPADCYKNGDVRAAHKRPASVCIWSEDRYGEYYSCANQVFMSTDLTKPRRTRRQGRERTGRKCLM
ncbi:hypothetical protein CHARACLAT_007601, partial [Characodon lateralis]|nr:hypothetical protein [Characodon lateralis]